MYPPALSAPYSFIALSAPIARFVVGAVEPSRSSATIRLQVAAHRARPDSSVKSPSRTSPPNVESELLHGSGEARIPFSGIQSVLRPAEKPIRLWPQFMEVSDDFVRTLSLPIQTLLTLSLFKTLSSVTTGKSQGSLLYHLGLTVRVMMMGRRRYRF